MAVIPTIPQKQNNISSLPRLSPEVMENMFNVYQTEDGKYYYNILQTLVFPQNLPDSFFKLYNTEFEDTWPLISYKHYNTTNLWWLILLANNILDATKIPKAGFSLKIPQQEFIQTIIKQLRMRQ